MQELKQYLKQTQPIVYQTLQNAFSHHKNSHAYIINGSRGSLVLPIAELMVQCLVCQNKDENGLACEHCVDCQKIKNHNYIDYIFYEGEDLKREQVNMIQREFSKSAVEQSNTKIYVINLIEKTPISSLNKLLKFIEEPASNIIAIFTTNSLMSILPTIISRCQVITLRQFSQKELVSRMLEESIDEEDARLLSIISNDVQTNIELAKTDTYLETKKIVKESLNYLYTKPDYFIFYMQTQGWSKLDQLDKIELYLDMLEVSFCEMLFSKEGNQEIRFFKEEIEQLNKKEININAMIMAIMTTKQELLSNANKQLVFDKLLITLSKG